MSLLQALPQSKSALNSTVTVHVPRPLVENLDAFAERHAARSGFPVSRGAVVRAALEKFLAAETERSVR
jgi:hypothetical protein